ncbi:MAG: hypothetical protein JNK81_16685 [Anaerolineales bacterium]|nr:hypothetical protein [Anaerolineales bacterium]
MLKNIIKFFAVLFILAGLVWVLQGLSILPGSYMSGNPQWAINGTITIVIAAVIFWFANRKA